MGDAKTDILWFIGIIFVIFILWLTHGGQQKAVQNVNQVTVTSDRGYRYPSPLQKNSLSMSRTTGGLTYVPLTLQGNGIRQGTSPITNNQSYPATTNQRASSTPTNPSSIALSNFHRMYPHYPTNFAADGVLSPFIGQVSLTRGGLSGNINAPNQEYMVLTANKKNPYNINLTGWKLVSLLTGHTATLGGAVILPLNLQNNTETDLFIRPEDTVKVFTGTSKINYSFLVNRCSGYFEQYNNFPMSFGVSCPSIMEQPLPTPPNTLDDACYSYLPSVPACRVITNFPPGISHQCQQFVTDHETYNSCVQSHKDDSNFYTHTWMLFLKRSQALWKTQREVIELHDADDKLVDTIVY